MNLYQALIRRANYQYVFECLRKKARAERYRLDTRPANRNFSLRWVLSAEDEVTSFLIREIRKGRYAPGVAIRTELLVDKKRIVYSHAWPHRIVESVLARAVESTVEPHLSDRLFSYRKGFNNHIAVREFAEFVKTRTEAEQNIYISRADVASYGDSIDTTRLLIMLKDVLGKQKPYALQLLHQFIQPDYRTPGDQNGTRLTFGLPTGFSIGTVGENIYLHDLDRCLAAQEGLFYLRYGDDFILAHSERDSLLNAFGAAQQFVKERGLTFKSEKIAHVVFCGKGMQVASDETFRAKRSIDYLGYGVSDKGEIFLSTKKVHSLQRGFRKVAKRAFLANQKTKNDKAEVVQAIVESMNIYLLKELRLPEASYALSNTTDDGRLRELDRWIAKMALRYVYGSGHDRVFRYMSFRRVRESGLLSLVHLKNISARAQWA